MSTFFVDPGAITPPTIRITGDLLHHLRDSLRLHPGDSLSLNDGCGLRYRIEVTYVSSQAIDGRIAYLMSSGSGDKARIYKTSDGGEHWDLQFTNPDPKGFFDSIAFWDAPAV